MPTFYFGLWNGRRIRPDEYGVCLKGTENAFEMAVGTAREPTPAPVAPVVIPSPIETTEVPARKYPVAKTREGKRVATVYLEKEALRQLQKLAFDEETTLQALLCSALG